MTAATSLHGFPAPEATLHRHVDHLPVVAAGSSPSASIDACPPHPGKCDLDRQVRGPAGSPAADASIP
jgi:hypothetical protein